MGNDDDPLAAWARSGAMALTGRAGGPPLGPPSGFVERLWALEDALARDSARAGTRLEVDALALLGERAALAGLQRAGDRSCGGATRLLRTGDGWLAVSLARPSDIELLPAWLHGRVSDHADPWDAVAHTVTGGDAATLAAEAQLLGLPVAALPTRPVGVPGIDDRVLGDLPLTATTITGSAPPAPPADLLVVDLSSLWAGPLCAHLLGATGARIVKVESTTRPDGARSGTPAFFDLLHTGHESVAVDFTTAIGREALQRLLGAADVVIEASRPRALEQLGIDAVAMLCDGGPRIWLSITGYGRTGAMANNVAFGDDGAVAGGLVVWDGQGPCFCTDAVADPVTGLVAAAAVLGALAAGGRWLLDVSLQGVAAHFTAGAGSAQPALAAGPDGTVPTAHGPLSVAPPRARRPIGAAPPLGAHTEAILGDLARHTR